MKKLNFFLSAAAALTLFTACSDEKIGAGDEPIAESGKQYITVAVADASAASSRAGRPLESSEPGQAIENVVVFITDKDGNVQWAKKIDNWMTSSDVTTYDNGRKTRIEIKKAEFELEDGQKVFAYGYHGHESEEEASKVTSDWTLDNLTNLYKSEGYEKDQKDIKIGEALTISLTEDAQKKGVKAEEIFAGDATVEKEENAESVTVKVVLNRQVAGSFAYLEDIPYEVYTTGEGEDATSTTATILRLMASDENTSLAMGMFTNDDHGQGNNATTPVKAVMNGFKAASTVADPITFVDGVLDGVTVYEIDLNDWFTEIVEEVKTENVKNDDGTDKKDDEGNVVTRDVHTGYIDITKWNDTEEKGHKGKYKKGSVFAGSFIIPFAKKADANTFQLQLCAKVGEGDAAVLKVVRHWNVTLPTESHQLKEHLQFAYNADGSESVWSKEENAKESKYIYSILRNHLYGLGTRTSANPKYPDNPSPDDPDPDPDDDDPTSLKTAQELVLKVNSQWEVIYNMGLD
ncbi:MAG: hypothetical protein NC342_01295 [Pseudoflavonifractor sp.]|nr:hypothetical protein [Alloprevotella sp.]MCM1116159.1 hypothetical protein [Pseudoflavonifractor sp.]